MKKGIVALLVVLALVIIVSPGIVGRIAEKGIDENLNWAAQNSGDVVVSSEEFDRGWFSSEGQHRIEIKDGELSALLGSMAGSSNVDDMPVLVVNTHMDHGLIPVSSMAREKGSLAPGLGSAVSTLSLDFGSGETVDIPGTIYSKVGLGGETRSTYVLEAGSREESGSTATWEATEVEITTNPSSGDVEFAGEVGSISFGDGIGSFAIEGLDFSGNQEATKFGISVGEMKLELDAMSFSSGDAQTGGIKNMSVDGYTNIDGGKLSGRTLLDMQTDSIAQFGEFSVSADISLEGADAEAVGALQKALEAQRSNPDPMQALGGAEKELKRVLASGFEVRFDKFDVTSPMGKVTTKLDVKLAEEDAATFEWTSLLQSAEASADISVPEALVNLALQMNPQAGAVVGMGFLQKNGDVYEMDVEYKKGLLLINGAPMPIPLGAFQ